MDGAATNARLEWRPGRLCSTAEFHVLGRGAAVRRHRRDARSSSYRPSVTLPCHARSSRGGAACDSPDLYANRVLHASAQAAAGSVMVVAVWNMAKRPAAWRHLLEALAPDLALLQETPLRPGPSRAGQLLHDPDYAGNSLGSAIYLRVGAAKPLELHPQHRVWFMAAEVGLDGTPRTLLAQKTRPPPNVRSGSSSPRRSRAKLTTIAGGAHRVTLVRRRAHQSWMVPSVSRLYGR